MSLVEYKSSLILLKSMVDMSSCSKLHLIRHFKLFSLTSCILQKRAGRSGSPHQVEWGLGLPVNRWLWIHLVCPNGSLSSFILSWKLAWPLDRWYIRKAFKKQRILVFQNFRLPFPGDGFQGSSADIFFRRSRTLCFSIRFLVSRHPLKYYVLPTLF